jgi:hypothetical protein
MDRDVIVSKTLIKLATRHARVDDKTIDNILKILKRNNNYKDPRQVIKILQGVQDRMNYKSDDMLKIILKIKDNDLMYLPMTTKKYEDTSTSETKAMSWAWNKLLKNWGLQNKVRLQN